jgi:hypothetical protein
MITASGPEATERYAMKTVAVALELYAKTGMKANRAYTPSNMLRFAAAKTGMKFKARDYLGAAKALRAKCEELQ